MTGDVLALRRTLPMLIWVIAVALGMLYLTVHKSDSLGPRATRELPSNTLLLKNDLVPDSYAEHYVVAPEDIPAGVNLRPQDVGPMPLLPSGLPVGTYYSLPIAPGEIAGGPNAGAEARLCGKSGDELALVKILVVRCDHQAVGVACSALVQVPDGAAAKLAVKSIKDQATAKELVLLRRCTP